MTRKQVKRKRTAKLDEKRSLWAKRKPLTGRSVHVVSSGRTGVTIYVLEQTAIKVAGNPDAAHRWMDRAHPLLGDLTPRQAVERNRGDEALGILLNIAGA